VHTPDSSRYWIAQSYEERFQNGLEPENVDKVFLFWAKEVLLLAILNLFWGYFGGSFCYSSGNIVDSQCL